jgi:hypothetical protein
MDQPQWLKRRVALLKLNGSLKVSGVTIVLIWIVLKEFCLVMSWTARETSFVLPCKCNVRQKFPILKSDTSGRWQFCCLLRISGNLIGIQGSFGKYRLEK